MPRGSVREELVQLEAAKSATANKNVRDTYIDNYQSDESDWEDDMTVNTSEIRHLLQRDSDKYATQRVTTTVPLSIGDDFLKRIDENVQTASLSASRQERRVQEVISNLTSDTARLPDCSWDGVSSKSGSGVTWPCMIVAAVFTAVVVPIVIILYWYLTPDHNEVYNHITTERPHS